MACEYEYTPLGNSSDIRLLELSPGNPDDPIEACLRCVSLCSTMIQYEAISYTWGNPSKCEAVNTPQGAIPITHSLHKILRRLRSRHQARLLWADAVCINQDDGVEKSHQVRMMGDIYKYASRTPLCLTDDPRPVRDLIFLWLYPLIMMFLVAHRQIQGGTQIMFRPLLTEKALAQDWFTRIWVVQEYLVSEKCVFIFVNYEWGAEYFETVTMVRQMKPESVWQLY
jgi:hypothetical protein